MQSAHKIQWPHIAHLQMLNLTQQIKLTSIEIAVSSNLYEMRLNYTGDVRSEKICTNQTYAKDSSALRTFKMDPKKRIAAMSLNMNEALGNIFGMRIIDDTGAFLMDELWFQPAEGVATSWKQIKIPAGKEIIGVHASHDGDYITNLGLIVWTPNPDAKKVFNADRMDTQA